MIEQVGVFTDDIFAIITQWCACPIVPPVFIIVESKAADISTKLTPGQREVGVESQCIGVHTLVIVQGAVIPVGR